MSNININVGYNPKDFFYMNAIKTGDMPNSCEEILNRPYEKSKCVGEKFNDNQKECLDRELCKNKQLADTILDIQQTHSGSVGKFNDTVSVFNRELFKTANLSIGIMGLLVLIYRFRKV
jgi:hypothetical protein